MRRRPPRSTRTDTLFPYTTLFRSVLCPLSSFPRRREPMNADIGDFPHAPCSWIPACARMTESAEIIGVGLNLHHARRGGDDRGGGAFFRGLGLGCFQLRAAEAELAGGVARARPARQRVGAAAVGWTEEP